MSGPDLAVQVVAWNHAAVVEACLESVARQQGAQLELVVVDNASRDDTRERVARGLARARAEGLEARLLAQPRNLGFCGGHNRALAATRAPWVLLLNPDAELPPDFAARALEVVRALPPEVGTVAPRILLPDGRTDSAGLVRDGLRRAWDRGFGEPGDAYGDREEVFGASGAVALHRRAMLEDVAIAGEVLDERLFAYYDDLDLAWRARLRGWRCCYVPELVAVHRRGGRNALRDREGRRPDLRAQRLTVRNRLLVMARCERLRSLLPALPRLLAFELARVGFLALRAPRVLAAYPEAVAALPAALRSRRAIHAASPLRGVVREDPV